jgi:LAO/AO transport system kinase
MVTAVESNLALQSFPEGEWRPPIVKTEATTGRGVPELWAAIQRFRTHTEATREARRLARGEFRLRDLLTYKFLDHVERHVLAPGEFEHLVKQIAARQIDPYSAAADVLKRTLK